ncbi:MAG: Crp/Fnr family transcriptional regulator [Bacteroidia bacterium]
MHPFHRFIHSYVNMSTETWQQVEGCIVYKALSKGEVLLKTGEVCRHLYFVEEGFLRFFIWKNGEDVTKFFTEAPYVFTSQRSYLTASPATESIQAITPCTMWMMTKEDAEALNVIPSWNEFTVKIKGEVQFFTEEIYTDIQTRTAEERYRYLLEKRPALIRNVPQQYIASFLGIAPQSLSRIRKKMM